MRGTHEDERGFTLIETLIAIMLIVIVMAALAPMLYGTFRATASTNARSAATSLAVEASEQVRAYPYYEIGYYTSHQPSACATASSLTQVTLDPSTVTTEPLYHLATATTVNHTQYTLQRCVYWVDSTISGDTQAYKEVVITVFWAGQGTTLKVSQTSSLYPGGQGGYQAQDNFTPGGNSTTCSTGVTPGTPGGVTAVDDATAPTNTIDVSWTASNPAADYYVVLYTSQGDPGSAPIYQAETNYTISPETTATQQQITVGGGTQYWVQVQAVYCGTPSSTSQTATATTQSSSGSSTTTAASTTTTTTGSSSTTTGSTTTTSSTTSTTVSTVCSVYNLSVVPTGSTGAVSYVAMKQTGNNGHPAYAMVDYTSNTFSLTLSSANTANCQNIYVAYRADGATPTACNTGSGNGSNQCYTDWAFMTASGSGTFTGTASLQSNDTSAGWGTTGLSFVVYTGQGSTATIWSPKTAANVQSCLYNGSSCK